MYQRIEFKGLRKSRLFGYAADVPFFVGRRNLDFKPGLNVLFGPNGCGKSTLLRMLGATMCATQGGISAVTESVVRDTVEFGGSGAQHVDKIGLKVVHDGTPVLFCDPRQSVGIAGGAFDDDFIREGLAEVTNRRQLSHGQASLSRMSAILAVLDGKAKLPDQAVQGMRACDVNSVWKGALELVAQRMAASCDKGQSSLLLDEPEANFSMVWAARLWARLSSAACQARLQVIVATHSPFALGIPGANYIDFEEGYREQVVEALRAHPVFAEQETA